MVKFSAKIFEMKKLKLHDTEMYILLLYIQQIF